MIPGRPREHGVRITSRVPPRWRALCTHPGPAVTARRLPGTAPLAPQEAGMADLTDRVQVQAWYLHISASVSEGLCPLHHTRMEPETAADDRIAGFCTADRRWWWYRPATQEAGWSAGVWNPVTSRYFYPDWLA